MKRSTRAFTIGTVIAAGAGFIAGILTAPKSGRETRADIAEAVERAATEAERTLQALYAELLTELEIVTARAHELKGRARREAEVYVRLATRAKEKAAQAIKAFRSGESTDEDLALATREAEEAIRHLKAFLQK